MGKSVSAKKKLVTSSWVEIVLAGDLSPLALCLSCNSCLKFSISTFIDVVVFCHFYFECLPRQAKM